ncbi:hypothetical protein ACN20G_03370 [Streptomyces sp. BI20]|uniref:hypothetical protein n=1 Tax=Streptomyces sp. BI20 TaxID=3403460 RepID=UPI003C7460DC
MEEFLTAALSFPAVVLTFPLLVVIGYWLVVAVGALDHDALDSDAGSALLGTSGVPLSVSGSLFTALAWFGCLAGGIGLDRVGLGGGPLVWLVPPAALVAARGVTAVLVRPLRGFFVPDEPPPSRQDFIGSVCVIRTGRVDARFGQAEVTAADGSSALVQVRRHDGDADAGPLSLGSTGLIYAWDEPGQFFWVGPYAAELDPGRH